MKMSFSFLLCLLFSLINGQSNDKQWLIRDGMGKNAFINQSNTFNNTLSSPYSFTLHGVHHPNRGCNCKAKNDIFVIYKNGQHYNSREKGAAKNCQIGPPCQPPCYPIDSFYPQYTNNLLDSTHYFTSTQGAIDYLYLTNNYEGDDPPELVKVEDGNTAPSSQTYSLGVTTPNSILTANHNVVRNKDITIIISMSKLKALDNFHNDRSYYLRCSTIKPYNPQIPPFQNKLFENSPMSSPTSQYNNTSINISAITSNLIKLNINIYQYQYINLRPTDSIIPYLPIGLANPNQMVFEIVDGPFNTSNIIARLEEEISDSHDPNWIKVESICRNNLGEHFIKYQVHFQNTSFYPASNLKAELTFPSYLDTSCIQKVEGNVAGSPTNVNLIRNADQPVQFEFDSSTTVVSCSDTSSLNFSHGFIRFWIKVKDMNINISKRKTVIRPSDAYVSFNQKKYLIDKFIDLYVIDSSNFIDTIRPIEKGYCQIECSRPVPSWWERFVAWFKKLFGIKEKKMQIPNQ